MHTEALSQQSQFAAMDETMEAAPLFGRRTAQQEYDAVSRMAVNTIEDKQARLQRAHEDRRAAFCRMVTQAQLSAADEAIVNSCIEQNATGDVLRVLVKACLLGNSTQAFALASSLREDAANTYADCEEANA